MKSTCLNSAIALSLLSPGLFAQAEENTQKPIIVTASRTAQTVDAALASVDVITREDIEQSQARDLPELLRMQAGVDISRSGGYGSLTNVHIRGANSNHTLFLMDGMRVSSATTGTFAIEHLSLDNVDRIEIVRGPRSTQYGSEAIGGIIHIFTRKDENQTYRASVGSYNTREASAGITLGDITKLSLNVSHKQSDGFSATNPRAGFFYNADDDAYRNNSFNIGFSSPLTNRLKLSINGWGSDAEIEFDQGTSNTTNQSFMINLDHQITNNWSQRFSLGYNYEEIITASSFPSIITSKRGLFEWQHDIGLSDNLLAVVGYSGYEDEAENFDSLNNVITFDNTIDNDAVFASLQYGLGDHDLMYTIRNDDHSNFGNHVTQQISWGTNLNQAMRVITTFGSAFRAPTANELYHPGYPTFAGNPNLQPEKSIGGDITFKWQVNANNDLDITYFSNKIKNLIAYEGTDNQAININRSRTKGFEIKHGWREGDWRLNTAITLQKAYDESTRTDLLRRPREKLALSLTRIHSSTANTRAEIVASSKRQDIANQVLDEYAIMNLATQFEIDKGLLFEGRIENLFDKEYEHAAGFNTPGLSMYFGFRYQPQ